MQAKKNIKIVIGLLLILIMGLSNVTAFTAEPDLSQDKSIETSLISDVENDYYTYSSAHKTAKPGLDLIAIDFTTIQDTSADVKVNTSFEGLNRASIYTGPSSSATFSFQINNTGLYRIKMKYFNNKGNGDPIERIFKLDGTVPFREANFILFDRIWKDAQAVKQDIRDNDIRPRQVEQFMWQDVYLNDSTESSGDFWFYLEAGQHKLQIDSTKEPMTIGSIEFDGRPSEIKAYNELILDSSDGAGKVSGLFENGYKLFQAEDNVLKSDKTLFAISDKTSPLTVPYSPNKQRLNMIGGSRWKAAGQWIEWKIDVPKAGLYRIGFRSKQNFNKGINSYRRFTVNGYLPFIEMESIAFPYSDNWNFKIIGNEKEDYYISLKEGPNTIRLENVIGDLKDLIAEADRRVAQLNKIYWDILTVSGTEPDVNRDYKIDSYYPDISPKMKECADALAKISNELASGGNEKSSNTAPFDTLANQLKKIAAVPRDIPKNIKAMKDNIGAIANWSMSVKNQPLQIDSILLLEANAKTPKAETGVWGKIVHEIKVLFFSFVEDYSLQSGNNAYDKNVSVWIGTGVTGGRDQAQALRQMVNDNFSPDYKVNVNLQLVSPGTLLPSILAGKGPDVSLQVSGSEPVNLAMRNATLPISDFSDFDEISKRFMPSAILPFKYLDKVYALPETQSFPMMFYRKDILDSLGIEVGNLQTWDDFVSVLPIIQKKYMTVGMMPTVQNYVMFLYQMGGSLYKDGGKASNLDDKISVNAFKKWSDLYVGNGLPIEFNFENRFRVGEIPIGIADYTTFNLLTVSAPEIKGLWGMVPVPGIKSENGSINRVVAAGGAGCVLLRTTKDRQSAWEFMKWWTSEEIQLQFGNELESIMGMAARYGTANVEAFKLLPWSEDQKDMLLTQWENTMGVPEVPGGYYTARGIEFAFRDVLNTGVNPRESLRSYVNSINEEIKIKRNEFGLK